MRSINGTAQSNILDLDSSILFALYRDIEHPESTLKDLIACADQTKYQLDPATCAGIRRYQGGPLSLGQKGEALLQIWGNRGMSVAELAAALKILRLEKPLMHLPIEPEPLVLLLDIPPSHEVEEGDILKLRCAAEGFPFPRYCWFKGEKLIVTNRTGILEITNVGLNNTGSYICRIHNSDKNQIEWTSWCMVHVFERLQPLVPPSVTPVPVALPAQPRVPLLRTQLPLELFVNYKEPLRLEFEATGPGLTYSWLKNGTVMDHQPLSACLQIREVDAKDHGTYQCVVANDHGDVRTAVCKVNINFGNFTERPVIITHPQPMECYIGQTAEFSIKVSCSKAPIYQWYYKGVELQNECGPKLQLEVTSQSQEGDVRCVVRTEDPISSVISRDAKLTVRRTAQVYTATDKVALILGQSSYKTNNPQLPAVKNDIYDAYEVFSALGFKTLSFLDNTLDEMNQAVDMVINLMNSKSNNTLYVVLYILGHGFEYQGQHYLMPHDAQEGPEVSGCLCIEDVDKKIQDKLNPAMLFMGIDICRRSPTHTMTEKLPPPSSLPVCKKRIIFYAATTGEESCEEEVMAAKASTLDTNKHRVRGIFSRDFLSSLREHSSLKFVDMYKVFNENFRRPNPVTTGKTMHPDFHINLEEDHRSLGDVIQTDGQEAHYQQRLENWAKLNEFFPRTKILLTESVHYINVTCRQRGSNILEIQLQESPGPHHNPVDFCLMDESVPTIIRPVEEIPSDQPKTKIYRLFNLQRLECDLEIWIHVVYHLVQYTPEAHTGYPQVCDIPQVYKLNLSRPLVSRVWQTVKASQVVPFQRREATEHQDDLEYSSLHSSCSESNC